MFKESELREYHQKISEQYSQVYPDFSMGVFNNNHIMFVSQAPEQYNDEKNSFLGKNLSTVIGNNWGHITFTTLLKSTFDYSLSLTQTVLDRFSTILEQEIVYVQPNIIVALGSYMCQYFGVQFEEVIEYKGTYVLGMRFPKYYMTDNEVVGFDTKLTELLDNHFKKKAIVRVTHSRIYYRDAKFNLQTYRNHCNTKMFFVPDAEGKDGHTYEGVPVKKIEWGDVFDYPATYEAHLQRKDQFYYNTYGDSKHSKIVRYTVYDIENEYCNDIINTPGKILSICWWNNIDKEYITAVLNNNTKISFNKCKVLLFDSEKEMIEEFLREASKSDVILGWYSNGFDTPYIINRARLLDININRYFSDVYLDIDPATKEVKSLRSENVVFFDALEFYKKFTYYSKPPSYSLGVVAKFLFGDTKVDVGDIINTYNDNIDLFIEYNLHDVELCKRIIDVANVIGYSLQLQQVCPQDFENVYYNSKTIENLLHQRYWQKKIYFPSKIQHQKVDFEGAIVLNPVEGTHKNVAVFDFAAMYTSIYITFNYSPETIIKDATDYSNDDILIHTDIGDVRYKNFDSKPGILPLLEKEMLTRRNEFKHERDKWPGDSVQYRVADELQGTFKTILNSIYGVAAYDKFILFNPLVAASITATARELIKFVAKKAEENGSVVLYGDTDSLFIHIDGDTTEEFVENSKKFEKQINQSFKEFVRQFTHSEYTQENCALKIEFEKAFDSILLTNTKKRYFGNLIYRKGKIMKEKILSVTGFETRRDDTPDFFKERLEGMYKLILDNDVEQMKKYCKETKTALQTQHPSMLTIKIKLSQGSEQYVQLPIHVRALRNSGVTLKRGDAVHMLYVKGNTEVIHYEIDKNYDIDYTMYYEKFFENKVRLISEKLWQVLFSEQHSLASWLN